jgi:hypothetical protein
MMLRIKYQIIPRKDSSVGIAYRYGLDGPRIESRWRRGGGPRFSALVQTGCGVHPASHNMSTGSFLLLNIPVRGVNHPPHLALTLKKE